jgi:hypothetical protein
LLPRKNWLGAVRVRKKKKERKNIHAKNKILVQFDLLNHNNREVVGGSSPTLRENLPELPPFFLATAFGLIIGFVTKTLCG